MRANFGYGTGWVALIVVALTTTGLADEFADRIQPLLKQHCVRCHGPNQPKGELNLSTPVGVARGGESGPAVVAGQLKQGSLWAKIAGSEMPPDEPLSAADQTVLREWIVAGAAGLTAADNRASDEAEHWAFRPLPLREPPVTCTDARLRTKIDHCLQQRLTARGLSLGPAADAVTLVRRVCLDATGLPPTPAEIDQFLADGSVDAYERMVDRYLESPRFGERWGKHWLDASGYADSNGYFSADTDRPLAYRYRDYVIRSLNDDKPFDRFVREQLAGDELASFRADAATSAATIELLEATHFLRNGQDGTDIGVQEPEAFEIDRRAALEACVQVTASSLLGLTLHCARCHDHKFEPITQREYYQFQAIFFPAFNPQDWVNPQDRVVYAHLPGEREQWSAAQARLAESLVQLRRELLDELTRLAEPTEQLLEESFADASWATRWTATAPGDDRPSGQLTVGGTQAPAAQVVDGRLQVLAKGEEAWLSTAQTLDWSPDEVGDWIQVTFDLVTSEVAGVAAARIGYALAVHDFDDSAPLEGGNLLIDGHPSAATQVYRDYPGTDQRVLGAIGGQGYQAGHRYGIRITRLADEAYRLEHVYDDLPDGKSLDLQAADLPDGGFAFFLSSGRSYEVDNVRVTRSRAQGSTAVAELRQQMVAKRQEYERRRTELETQRTPQPGRPIAWVTDKSSRSPEVPLLIRGLYQQRGPLVEPAALNVLTDAGHDFQPSVPVSGEVTTGRRLGLAEWLTRSDGRPAALLARVHVNRIWRQYFGRGLVATTDNLGQSGASPTHPELLDYLAGELVRSGWSQKALHRAILRSTVYRQVSTATPAGLAADPDNRLLWRWPLRRLEAEVIRDAMLAVSGRLDLMRFGPYVPTRQTPVGEVVVDPQTAGAHRRSVYLQQRRSQTLSLLKVFDAPAISTICSTRPSSTVPLQSLALLNSDFALTCSEAFAQRLLRETGADSAELVDRAWRCAVGRSPTVEEAAVAVSFLSEQQRQYADEQSRFWSVTDLCQMLLASNAFLYLE